MDTVLCSIHAVEDHGPDFQKEVCELNSLIGLSAVKKEIYRIINLAMADMLRRQQDLKTSRQSYHMVFSGNPGTGKATVAGLLAKIFRGLGILSKGHLVEVGWPNLFAYNALLTAEKTRRVVESALGGILFFDTSCSLNSDMSAVAKHNEPEAVSALLKALEEYRDNIIVIIAGYPESTKEFLSMNPGLESRFRFRISFNDYSADEMTLIFWYLCSIKGFRITRQALDTVKAKFSGISRDDSSAFTNAHIVRDCFEEAVMNQAQRVVLDPDLSNLELALLTEEDVCV